MKKDSYIRIIILGLCLQIWTAALWAQAPGRKDYLDAEKLRKQNRYIEAIQFYKQAIRKEPSNYKYYFQKGKCEFRLNQLPDAKESFKSSIEFRDDYSPAYSLLAKVYKDEKDYENAAYYYEMAALKESVIPRKVQYILLSVNQMLRVDKIVDARRLLQQAIELDNDNVNVLYYYGEIHLLEGDWEQARVLFEQTLESDRLQNASPGETAKYYYGLGLAHHRLGNSEAADKAWSKANFGSYKSLIAQQRRENDHIYLYQLAVSYYLNGEYDESEDLVNKAIEMRENFSSAYLLKGKIAKQKGQFIDATQFYKNAIRFEGDRTKQAKLYSLLADLYMEYEEYQLATEAWTDALNSGLRLNFDDTYYKARAEFKSKNYDLAINTLEDKILLISDPKLKARYNFLIGRAAKLNGDMERARDAFKGALYGPYKAAAQQELSALSN